MNAPCYKVTTYVIHYLNKYIPLPFTFNIMNSMNLINEIKQIPFENYLCLALFDIPNMYTASELRTWYNFKHLDTE